MLQPIQLRAGDTYTKDGWRWVWAPPNGIDRGRWQAADGSRIAVIPPSEGTTHWTVIIPKAGKHITAEMEEGDTAFHYAASERKVRAN